MGTLWKIALRNTIRHKRRTIITAAVMMAGHFGLHPFRFAARRHGSDGRRQYVRLRACPRSNCAPPPTSTTSRLRPWTRACPTRRRPWLRWPIAGSRRRPRLRFVASLSNYSDVIPVLADGVDPVADAEGLQTGVLGRSRFLAFAAGTQVGRDGRHPRQGTRSGVGDSVLISVQTVDDVTNADEYVVAGLVQTPDPQVNESGLFMTLSDARDAPRRAANARRFRHRDRRLPAARG